MRATIGALPPEESSYRYTEPFDPDAAVDPMPGPTLRARVGDVVQLTFVNQVDSKLFGQDFDIEDCTHNSKYPEPFFDKYPNCLHGLYRRQRLSSDPPLAE